MQHLIIIPINNISVKFKKCGKNQLEKKPLLGFAHGMILGGNLFLYYNLWFLNWHSINSGGGVIIFGPCMDKSMSFFFLRMDMFFCH